MVVGVPVEIGSKGPVEGTIARLPEGLILGVVGREAADRRRWRRAGAGGVREDGEGARGDDDDDDDDDEDEYACAMEEWRRCRCACSCVLMFISTIVLLTGLFLNTSVQRDEELPVPESVSIGALLTLALGSILCAMSGPTSASARRRYPVRPLPSVRYPVRPLPPARYPVRPLPPARYPVRPLPPVRPRVRFLPAAIIV
jgi:hypothetical protein